MVNILFVCKYNRFRSKIAEAAFKKLNRNKKLHVRSAGLIKGFPSGKQITNEAREFGLRIKDSTQPMSEELFRWADIIVNVADDVHPSSFSQPIKHGKKVIHWNIEDQNDTVKSRMIIIPKIIKKVEEFVRKI